MKIVKRVEEIPVTDRNIHYFGDFYCVPPFIRGILTILDTGEESADGRPIYYEDGKLKITIEYIDENSKKC